MAIGFAEVSEVSDEVGAGVDFNWSLVILHLCRPTFVKGVQFVL